MVRAKKRIKKGSKKRIFNTPCAYHLDRDISLLAFYKRVLFMAEDESTPLLERLRFLGIFHDNINEFFMKRVNLIRSHALMDEVGATSTFEHLSSIREGIQDLFKKAETCFFDKILVQLEKEHIEFPEWKDLTEEETSHCYKVFQEIFPILIPLAVDIGHPFPFISNLSHSLGVKLYYPGQTEPCFSRVKIPKNRPFWIRLKNKKNPQGYRWISLEEIIKNHLSYLFPKMDIVSITSFRITRNMEFEWDMESGNLMEMVALELKERRFGEVVKLEIDKETDPWILSFLKTELELHDFDIYEQNMDYTSFRPVLSSHLGLQYEPWNSIHHKSFKEEGNIFQQLAQGDILLHHPYHNFNSSIERFIRQAAMDPKVLAIKMTMYRTDENSSFIQSLLQAAEAGKQVVCLIELQARMDEERNISWAQRLEDMGVHVVYGIMGLKTHCKTILVVREEGNSIKCYCHIGTGNYHAQTAKIYTDLGLFTCDPLITKDLVELFHYLTGRSKKEDYSQLLVSPITMKKRLLKLIKKEEDNAKAKLPSGIVIKCNNLEDKDIIDALSQASNAGVKIHLIIRSICVLKPNLAEFSENIQVRSFLGRFLEHSRIFCFKNGTKIFKEGRFFIGSADLMYRNLCHRVEVLTPIKEKSLKEAMWKILSAQLSDQVSFWEMKNDGQYVYKKGTRDVQLQLAKEIAKDNGE